MMGGEWITGEKIMTEYGKAASEIGQACYDEKLHAFTADVLIPVCEESKLAHIPKYPPVGVNPLDHKKYGVFPKWNWSKYLRLDINLKNEYEVYLSTINNGEDILDYTEFQQEYRKYESIKIMRLREEGLISFNLDVRKLNETALQITDNEKYGPGGNKNLIEYNAALHLMEGAYIYEQTNNFEQKRTFCFLYTCGFWLPKEAEA